MRFLMIAAAVALLLAPAAAPAQACGLAKHSVMAASAEYSAKKHKKRPKKTVKVKKEKVEYMRAVPVK